MESADSPTAPWRISAVVILAALAACTPEPPPRTVADFLDNPRLLEATMVRCAENRAELKYTAECLNAREAVDRIAAQEEAERRVELEAQSARKREALRRAQEAAAAARARAEEEARLREEAEYLGQFEEVTEDTPVVGGSGSAAGDPSTQPTAGSAPAADNSRTTSDPVPPPSDLGAVREELRQRQESGDQR